LLRRWAAAIVSVSLKYSNGLKRWTEKRLGPDAGDFFVDVNVETLDQEPPSQRRHATIMPSRVSAERSLCAQIAATATFKISISFTVS